MVRSITANLQTLLDQNLATEPINIIEVRWTENGSIHQYADKDIPGASGQIAEISGLDNTIVIQGVQAGVSGDSQQISVTLLDDRDIMKIIIDNHDIHKQPVWVYQSFVGADHDNDKALIFKGEISSPMQWVEADRTIRFNVLSVIENAEVGFSMEEGDFPFVPQDLIGQPWPLIFGTVKECPALRTRSPRIGVLKTGFGIKDFVLEPKREQADLVCCPWRFLGFSVKRTVTNVWGGGPLDIKPRYRKDVACQCKKAATACELSAKIATQSAFEFSSIQILDGELFPQGKFISLNIDGARVSGKFNGTPASPSNTFLVDKYTHPKELDPEFEVPEIENFGCDPVPNGQETDSLPNTSLSQTCILTVDPEAGFVCNNYTQRFFDYFDQGLDQERVQQAWTHFANFQEAGFFWADPGAEVTLWDDKELVYVANILPSTIHQVKAYRTFTSSNLRRLITVPNIHYTVRQSDFNEYTTQEIVLNQPLSLIPDEEGWEDDLFVTLTSSVGDNMVDIMEWLIDKYTSFTWDSSFATVKTKLTNYPMDFMVPGRMNILDLLQKMAFWNRCALTLRNDVFHLTYLSDEPAADETLNDSEIIKGSLVLDHTSTEDVVTKFIAEWRPRCSLEDPLQYVLRYNVRRYGVQEETFDCFVFRHQVLVDKSSKFWLLRMGNTWRKVTCSVPIKKLKLESIDGVWLTDDRIGDGIIKCRVETAVYNSDNNTIDLVLWTPIRSGSRVPYDFAYPAAISTQLLHPTKEDLQFGNAGSSGPNVDVTPPNQHVLGSGSGLPQGFTFGQSDPCSNISQNNLGGPNLASRCRPDMGDSRPSDIDDQKPTNTDLEDDNSSIPNSQSPKHEISIQQFLDQQSQRDQDQGDISTNGSTDTRNRNADDDADSQDPNDSQKQKELAEELPNQDELQEQNICHYWVKVFGAFVKTVQINNGDSCLIAGNPEPVTCQSQLGWCNCSQQGKSGCVVGNVLSSEDEFHAFATSAARDAFFNSILDIIDGPGTVGSYHPFNATKGQFTPAGCTQVTDAGFSHIGYGESSKGSNRTVFGNKADASDPNEAAFGTEGYEQRAPCIAGMAP